MTFNIQAIKAQVRGRRRELEDRLAPLVNEHYELETRTTQDRAAVAKLTIAVSTVEGAGGDASSLKDQIASIKSRLDPDADRLARLWALSRNEHYDSYPADWQSHGRAAGPIRNQQMIDEGRPTKVFAFPGGRGTADMVRRARAAGIPVFEFPTPEQNR